MVSNRPLKNVFEATDARQKQAKKRSLCMINKHFEPVFNTAAVTQIVFQQPAKRNSRSPNINFPDQTLRQYFRGDLDVMSRDKAHSEMPTGEVLSSYVAYTHFSWIVLRSCIKDISFGE